MVDGSALPPIRSSDAERGRCIDVLRDAVVRAGELPTRSAWRSLFGTTVLDLREVRLGGPAIELHLFSLFGTTTVLVPPGIAVEVQGGGPFASRVIEPPPWPAAPMRRGCASRFPGPAALPESASEDR